MSATTVKAQPAGTGGGRSVTGSVMDFFNQLGSGLGGLAEQYLKFETLKSAQNYTSQSTPISSDNSPKTVSAGSAQYMGVSTNQLLLIGGGVFAAVATLYLVTRKK